MSGHSKWSTIKRKKGAADAKRGQIFTRLLREVMIAARLGGGDPAGNPRLRSAIQECKSNNCPNDKVDRAIKKGIGELEGSALDEVVYEGYGPGGVAVLVDTMTDNRNRTVSEVRHVFSKYNGNLGENGCVSYMFELRGFFLVNSESLSEEGFIELALELDVDDISTDKGSFEMYTAPEDFDTVREALEERGVAVEVSQRSMIPSTLVAIADEKAPQFLRFLEAMEDLDDVQNVWANFDISEAALEAAD